jgi:hypothetical protein
MLRCLSVPAGWQSAIGDYTFGPVFVNIQDLWAWQKACAGDLNIN